MKRAWFLLGVFMLLVPLVARADFKDVTLGTMSEFQQCLEASQDFTQEQLDAISQCFEDTFTEPVIDPPPPDPEPEPEPPPPGFVDCGGNQSQAGLGIWNEWCTDESRNFTEPESDVMGMKCNAEAARNRFSGCVNRAVAPPTIGSNRVVMTCDMKFNQGWLNPVAIGGQHLFKIGEGPIACSGGGTSQDHIRFDFGCFAVGTDPNTGTTGNGFRDGFRVLVYHQKGGQHIETWFSSSTKMPNVFVADKWTPVKVDCRYDPSNGRCDLTMTIGGQTRTASTTVPAGISTKLGDSLGWGNVDHSPGQADRPGTFQVRNLRYSKN